MIRDIQNIDDDIIRAKRIIKEKLINDPDIIEALDNQKLDPEEPDTYVNENIFDYIRKSKWYNVIILKISVMRENSNP